MINNRNLFRLTRFVLLGLPVIAKAFAKLRKPAKRLLIIKTDAIGDYILFRNFISDVRSSDRFSGYEIDLLGNPLWKEITTAYDQDHLARTFYIRPVSLYERPWQTLKTGWALFSRKYAVVLQPSFTRNLMTDGLAALTGAREIAGFLSDAEAISEKYKKRTDGFYTRLLLLPAETIFEFERTRFFFSGVTGVTIRRAAPSLKVTGERSGIMIFTGAGNIHRSWGEQHFLALIQLILSAADQTVFLAGAAADRELNKAIAAHFPSGRVINIAGQHTLPETIDQVAGSMLVIANETSAVHMAAACSVPSVCILGGGHFGRFAPYPESIEHRPVCVYEKMPCYNCNWLCKFEITGDEPFPCISAISVEKVWKETAPFLTDNHV